MQIALHRLGRLLFLMLLLLQATRCLQTISESRISSWARFLRRQPSRTSYGKRVVINCSLPGCQDVREYFSEFRPIVEAACKNMRLAMSMRTDYRVQLLASAWVSEGHLLPGIASMLTRDLCCTWKLCSRVIHMMQQSFSLSRDDTLGAPLRSCEVWCRLAPNTIQRGF